MPDTTFGEQPIGVCRNRAGVGGQLWRAMVASLYATMRVSMKATDWFRRNDPLGATVKGAMFACSASWLSPPVDFGLD